MNEKLAVRPWVTDDIPNIINYFLKADDDFVRGMGANSDRFPSFSKWKAALEHEIKQPPIDQGYYYMIWLIDGVAVGHCNVNMITYSQQANMHLHLWRKSKRQKGMGVRFVQLCIPYFFKRFELQTLLCEPYALNPAPNKTLPKAGFTFVKRYRCTPGPINFEQEVSRFEMSSSHPAANFGHAGEK